MRKILTSIVVALVLSTVGCVSTPQPKPKDVNFITRVAYTLQIVGPLESGKCSGTAISATAILTAKHCIPTDSGVIKIDGVDLSVKKYIQAKNDHAIIVLTSAKFSEWATVDLKGVQLGQDLTIYGNPGPWDRMLRRGYVTGSGPSPFGHQNFLDMNGFHGDSGSGLFNKDGDVVGVLTNIFTFDFSVNKIKLMAFSELNGSFSDAEWKEAGVVFEQPKKKK